MKWVIAFIVGLFIASGFARSAPGWSPEFRERMQASCLVAWAGQPKVEEVCPCFVRGIELSGVTEQEAFDFFYNPEPAASDAKVREKAQDVLSACVETHLGILVL